jgi:dTDP-D-glucose 4,6-dehydratase
VRRRPSWRYGTIDHGSWTEESPLRPRSPYAAAKASADLIALVYATTHGLPVSITRCGNNYGPRQFPEKLIPLFGIQSPAAPDPSTLVAAPSTEDHVDQDGSDG